VFEFGSLRFRPIEKDDLKLLHGWENDFELMMFSRSKPMSFTNMAQLERQYEEWVKDEKTLRFMVELLPKNEPIGIAKIEREEWGNVRSANVGTYIGNKGLWGKGIGRQISVALLEMSFVQLNMERCEAFSVEYNKRAHRVLESCGFKKAGVMRQSNFVGGRKWDSYCFDILREEYLALRTKLLKQVLGDGLEGYLKRIDPTKCRS